MERARKPVYGSPPLDIFNYVNKQMKNNAKTRQLAAE
jgi:hypothetical protein